MDALMIRERYKVVRVVYTQPDYALLEAVDIAERETPLCLLNLFEGELLHRYARICSGIQAVDCPAFRGMFLEDGTLTAVFDDCRGENIDRIFYRGDEWSWEERLRYAEMVFHQALSLANLPPEVSCAAMLSRNLIFELSSDRVKSRYMLLPMEDMNARELAILTTDQVRKILPRTIRAGKAEREFLHRLESGVFRSIVPLYAYWREMEPVIREEREEFKKKSVIRRGFILLGRAIRRAASRGGR